MADDVESIKELKEWKEGPSDTIDGLNEHVKAFNALLRAVKKLVKNKPKALKGIIRNNGNSEWRRVSLLGVDIEAVSGDVCDCDCDCDGSGSGGEDVGSS